MVRERPDLPLVTGAPGGGGSLGRLLGWAVILRVAASGCGALGSLIGWGVLGCHLQFYYVISQLYICLLIDEVVRPKRHVFRNKMF